MIAVALSITAVAASRSSKAGVVRRMHRFDQLDFDAFSKQDWKLFDEIQLPMSTVAHCKNGCIAEEMLFWDNATYMQQLGVTP
jgi:hypothetical protein